MTLWRESLGDSISGHPVFHLSADSELRHVGTELILGAAWRATPTSGSQRLAHFLPEISFIRITATTQISVLAYFRF